MSTRTQKKIEKRRAKKAKASAHEKAQADRKASIRGFPDITIAASNAPAPLIRAIRAAANRIMVDQVKVFGDAVGLFHAAKRKGFPAVFDVLRDVTGLTDVDRIDKLKMLDAFPDLFGKRLFEALPASVRQGYFPYHDLECVYGQPTSRSITIRLDSLRSHKTPGGRAYSTPFNFTTEWDGRSLPLAFLKHAVDRIGLRCVGDFYSYFGPRLVFALLSEPIVERATMTNGQPALKFFVRVVHSSALHRLIRDKLGGYDTTEYVYLAGYCPVDVNDRLIAAITLLLPGMDNTPEASLFQRRRLGARAKEYKAKALAQSVISVLRDDEVDVLFWMHEQGFEQIRVLEQF